MTQVGWMFEVTAFVAVLGIVVLLSYLYRPVLGARGGAMTAAVIGAGIVAGVVALLAFRGGGGHPIAFLGLAVLASFVATVSPRSAGLRPLPVSVFALVWVLVVFMPVAQLLPDIAATRAGSADGFLDHGGALGALVAAGATGLGVSLASGRKVAPAPVLGSREGIASYLATAGVAIAGIVALLSLEFAVDEFTVIILVNGIATLLAGAVSWMVMDGIRGIRRVPWRLRAAVITGLVAAAPTAAFLTPLSAAALGALVGICSSVALRGDAPLRPAHRFAFAVHAYPAALGLVFLGLAAEQRGAIFTGQPGILLAQILGPLLAIVYSALVSAVLWLVLRKFTERT